MLTFSLPIRLRLFVANLGKSIALTVATANSIVVTYKASVVLSLSRREIASAQRGRESMTNRIATVFTNVETLGEVWLNVCSRTWKVGLVAYA